MFLVATRSFPPEIGGMQSLMGGLSESLLNHGPVKVFAYDSPNSIEYDKTDMFEGNLPSLQSIGISLKFFDLAFRKILSIGLNWGPLVKSSRLTSLSKSLFIKTKPDPESVKYLPDKIKVIKLKI